MLIKFLYILGIVLLTNLKGFTKEKDLNAYPSSSSIQLELNPEIKLSSLNWEKLNNQTTDTLKWIKINDSAKENSLINSFKNSKNLRKSFTVKALDRSVVVNNIFYPEISHYVPNGYVKYDEKLFNTSLRTISKLRFCDGKNFEYRCADGILNIDFNLVTTDTFSFNPRFSLQSISNRGTSFGEESSLGFKLAKQVSKKWFIAFGGENIIHLDKDIDLGRNYYLVTSTFRKLGSYSKKDNPSMLFFNVGIGSDFYGYKGNGFLGRTPCLGKPNLTGDAKNNCSWGPISSVAFAVNDRLSIVNEWFGYSYGIGISLKPIKENNIVFSIYATDFIKGFPKYANEHCPNRECSPRFYGNISLSF